MRSIHFIMTVCLSVCSCTSNQNDQNNHADTEDYKSTYDIEGIQLKILLPTTWSVLADSSNILIFKENCIDDVAFCPNIVVRVVDKNASLTLSDALDYYLRGLNERFSSIKIVSIGDFKIGENQCKIIDYKMLENETHLGSTVIFLFKNEKIVSFSFAAENYPEGHYVNKRESFMRIINSIMI